MAALTLPSTFFLFFSIVFITDTTCIGTALTLRVFRAEFLLEFGVGDLSGGFDIVRGDDISRYGRRLNAYVAGSTSCYAEQFEDIVELAVKVATDGDRG